MSKQKKIKIKITFEELNMLDVAVFDTLLRLPTSSTKLDAWHELSAKISDLVDEACEDYV